jgi:hypothetical protein
MLPAPNHNSRHSITTAQAMSINGLESPVASGSRSTNPMYHLPRGMHGRGVWMAAIQR